MAGISETLDWVSALVALNREDIQAIKGERVQELLNRASVRGT